MDFINKLMLYHPIMFKIVFGMAGTILILVLIMSLRFIREKFKELKAEKRLKEAESREGNLDELEKKLNIRESKLEEKLEKKYQKKRKELKSRASRQLKKEIVNVTGLPIENIVRRYGKLIKNDDLDSFWKF